MRQQTCKPFARQNKDKQNGFGICYHFAIKQEMRFSKSECFQGFSAHHIHFCSEVKLILTKGAKITFPTSLSSSTIKSEFY
jgi:hypothetical protein